MTLITRAARAQAYPPPRPHHHTRPPATTTTNTEASTEQLVGPAEADNCLEGLPVILWLPVESDCLTTRSRLLIFTGVSHQSISWGGGEIQREQPPSSERILSLTHLKSLILGEIGGRRVSCGRMSRSLVFAVYVYRYGCEDGYSRSL